MCSNKLPGDVDAAGPLATLWIVLEGLVQKYPVSTIFSALCQVKMY